MTRLGITIDYADDVAESASEAAEFERAGADVLAVAEAYSFDAVSRLGYLAAAEALPEELVRETALIGSESEVRDRVAALTESGVTTLMIAPVAPTREGRIAAVEAARGLVA